MTPELIERFFNKECSPEEAAQVAEYLKQHPEILEKNLSSQEWLETKPAEMPTSFWEQQWTSIQRQKAGPSAMIWLTRAAAAAMLIVVAGAGYFTFFSDTRIKIKQPAPAAVASVIPNRELRSNNTAEIIYLTLPDHSRVRLSPGSVVGFPAVFAGAKRDVTLEGEAWFGVEKNEAQPFTVYAGGLATTALGTEFTIDTRHEVHVKLHEGKVMITATGNALNRWKKNIYLLPGQELKYDAANVVAVVRPFQPVPPVVAKSVIKKKDHPSGNPESGMDFMNTSLSEVMTRLSAHYHQRIAFDPAEIEKMNFTGSISNSDSLDVVLKIIGRMNDLRIDRDSTGYSIKPDNNQSTNKLNK